MMIGKYPIMCAIIAVQKSCFIFAKVNMVAKAL